MPIYQGLASNGHAAYLAFLISLTSYLFFNPMRMPYSQWATIGTIILLALCYGNAAFFYKRIRAVAIGIALAHIITQFLLISIYFSDELATPRESSIVKAFIIITSFTGLGCFLIIQRAVRGNEASRTYMLFRLTIVNIAILVCFIAAYLALKNFKAY